MSGGKSGTANVAVKSDVATTTYAKSQVQTTLQCVHECHNKFDGAGDITVDFASAAVIKSLVVSGQLITGQTTPGTYYLGELVLYNGQQQIAAVDVRLACTVQTITNDCPNVGTYNVLVFSDSVSLLPYGALTRIVLTDIQGVKFRDATPAEVAEKVHGDGPGGDAWCHDWNGAQAIDISNIQFGAEKLLELTATDHSSATNSATAIDAAIRDLYVAEDPTSHTADVDINPTFAPSSAAEDIYLSIQRNDGWFAEYSDVRGGELNESLPVTDTARDFVITAWLDSNHNGVWDSGEDKREVDVHIYKLSIRVTDDNGDIATDTNGDTSDPQGPALVGEEFGDSRTEVDLSANCGTSASGLNVLLPNIPGMEFWTAASGGTRLQPDANGNIVNDAVPTSGQYSRTVWVSADPTVSANFSQITFELDPPQILEKVTVPVQAGPTGGLDVTQALINGYSRLMQQFAIAGGSIPVNQVAVKQANLALQLFTIPYAGTAWDIEPLKSAWMPINKYSQTLCTNGQGLNTQSPKYLVTVRDGAGNPEVYSADEVNYFLFGAAMNNVYRHWQGIHAAAITDPARFEADLLAWKWPRDDYLTAQSLWGPTHMEAIIRLYRTVEQYDDGARLATIVAFAKAGWYNDWNYINGFGIKDAKVCTEPYTGKMRWQWGSNASGTTIAFSE